MDPIDPSVSPCTDFYSYANNKWLKNNPMPDAKSRWGTFNILDEQTKANLKSLFDEQDGIIGLFYASGLDLESRNSASVAPIQDLLDLVDNAASLDQIWSIVALLHRDRVAAPFFSFYCSPDAKNANLAAAHLCQSGLGLPDRDYYDAESKAEIRAKYLDYAKNIFGLVQLPDASLDLLDFETKLAAVSLKMVERRDPVKTYNKRTLLELSEIAPNIAWETYFKTLGTSDFGSLVIENVEYLRQVSLFVKETDMKVLRAYLHFHIISKAAPFLSEVLENENFRFYKTVLSGIPEKEPLWKRVISTVASCLDDPVSKLYVDRFFPERSKKSALEMVQYIIEQFRLSIQNAEWMSSETKVKALEKLEHFTVKIGFPDKWKDFGPLNALIVPGNSFYKNIRVASRFLYRITDLDAMNKPVDRTKWEMAPYEINACMIFLK
jgi:putative endopeptidase